jgi:Cytochrome P450
LVVIFVAGILNAQYNAAFRRKHQLYLSILKQLGFGQRLMETRINVEVAEFIHQAKLKEGRPFNPKDLMHMCVVNIIISIFLGRRYPFGHPKLLHINDCIRKGFGAIIQELELFPMLQHVPPYRSRLQKFREADMSIYKATEVEVRIQL